ncbi:MAG: hypothetical protein KatS3mg050_1144 [Litorilinea sp.]|nr:MAG: hypothetical protein KatS3mg050_1144 [Litorilinea sp.]
MDGMDMDTRNQTGNYQTNEKMTGQNMAEKNWTEQNENGKPTAGAPGAEEPMAQGNAPSEASAGGNGLGQEEAQVQGREGEGEEALPAPVAESTIGSDGTSAEAEGDEVARLREELATVQARADEYLDQLQRTVAEFQNSRRRQEKQLADEIERANANLIKRLLPILDDFDLAFQNASATLEGGQAATVEAQQAWLEGFRQIQKKLLSILQDEGVTVVADGGPFDPNRHEAISSEPSDTVESGHIIEVVRAGYEYKGRVLRPALVRVAA